MKNNPEGITPSVKELVKHAKKNPTFEQLCDKLDKSPKSAKALLERAKNQGVGLRFGAGDTVGLGEQNSADRHVKVRPAKVTGEQRVAIFSDMHLGSKYCMRAQLRDFVQGAYDMGIRNFICGGDALEGTYRHAQFELSSVGLEDQTEELYETLPDLPITIYAITGNHEATISDSIGLDAGIYIQQRFACGKKRIKWNHVGRRQAYVHIGGVVIDVWHPRGSCGANITQPLRNRIAAYSPGEKPDILVVGHYHREGYVRIRGVHALALPCFQAPGGDFGNSLSGDPAMGGTVLSWTTTTDGNIRGFCPQFVSYFPSEPKRTHELVSAAY